MNRVVLLVRYTMGSAHNTKIVRVMAIMLSALLTASIGCDRFTGQQDIETVKRSSLNVLGIDIPGGSIPIGPRIVSMAGVQGSVSWKSFRAEKFRENPNIVVVQADITKPTADGRTKTATFQFLLN